MRCLECANTGLVAEASALCVDCGAGLCREHVVFGQRAHSWISSTGYGTRPCQRWTRAARCRPCAATCTGRAARSWEAGKNAMAVD
ncbi:DUF2180 family protein [Amycolatopsis sp. K13G38]|uniref:DUF2180 family protein n=1 Tax=Amycolatopsis acididurans TaxID=2724524 RepID=A0ABX1JBR9_9PSEU|nr:DUF2180 family protein [Amycolatopsis acididurans]NKQ56045.1 DUF2180 family protein [Amycolatopsis acididurans]